MEPISQNENNENKNPKSLTRFGYNTTFKDKIQFKNNYFSKKLARTPLKSKLNLMNSCQGDNSINSKNEKILKYPLLKSISSTNINIKKNKNVSYALNNNNNEINDYDEDDEYNKDALPDELDDFMHINENEIIIKNEFENERNEITGYKKPNVKIFENVVSPFGCNDNYVLAAHFDDSDGDNNNEINNKKKFDEYFDEPDDIDMDDSVN